MSTKGLTIARANFGSQSVTFQLSTTSQSVWQNV